VLYCHSIVQGPAALTNISNGQNFLFLFTSQLRIKLLPEIKGTAIRRQTSAERPLFETCLVRRERNLRNKCF